MAMEPTLEVSQGIYQRAAQQKQSTNQDFDFITDKRYCQNLQDRRMIADLVTLGDITVQSLFSKVCLKLIALDQGQQQQAQEKEKYVDDVIGVHLNGRQAIL
ncbi:hypothetical protein L596_026743 [Steinernema carpocapsae]|uniref:Uncharacterized protein n=1 Tax=Steinernema carpocapsae TaxID=34508 RepID=A0A4U5M2E5_STECR|nr:hypothetical protein L596_026743 [Steinernema carpocapsae]